MPDAPYVFVSYASLDRERVLPIVDRLEAAGVPVWIDRDGIHGGANYALEIAEAIERAAALLLMCSAASFASRNVKQEIALGWRFEKPYLPLLLETIEIPKDVAYWLEASQWIEVLDRPESAWLADFSQAVEPLGIAVERVEMRSAPRRTMPTIAGRKRELELIRRRIDRVQGGQGSLILIGGEAGIGKTTLADATLAFAEERDFVVLEGHCFDLAETPPYGPWIDLFAHCPAADMSLPDAFMVRGTVGSVPTQLALFMQVEEFLQRLSSAQPVALLLDDLHWSDPASLDLLRYLARSMASLPLLLLVTYRSEELTRQHALPALLPQLAREAGAERIELDRLDSAAIAELTRDRYGLSEADEFRLTGYLLARSEGNALFVGELLRALEETGDIQRVGNGWVLGDLAEQTLPSLLRQVIDARVDRFGETARELLGVAAVIGQTVPLDLWESVAQVDEDALLDLAERAEAARLLESAPSGDALRFSHALIREALYEGLSSLRRRRVHRDVAEALLAAPQPDPDALVYHLRRVDDPRLGYWLCEAGTRAFLSAAAETAVARYTEALPLLSGPEDGMRRYLARFRLAQMLLHDPISRAYMAEAVEVAETLGDPALAAFTRIRLGFLRGFNGVTPRDIPTGITEQDQALDVLVAYPDYIFPGYALPAPALDQGRCMHACALSNVGRLHESQALVQSGTITFYGYYALMQCAGYLGQPDQVAALMHDFPRSIPPADTRFLGYGQNMEFLYGVVPYYADDPGRLRKLADTAEKNLAQITDERILGFPAPVVQLPNLIIRGEWDEALSFLPLARRMIHGFQCDLFAFSLFGPLLTARGERDLAWALVSEVFPGGLDTAPGDQPLRTAQAMQLTAATMALDEHDLPTARAWLEAHDRWLAWSGAVLGRAEGALLWAQYHHASGDAAQARESAEQALADASSPRQPLALIAAHRFLGNLDTTDGASGTAEEHLQQSLTLADACRAPFERALTLLEIAKLRGAEGRTNQARELVAAVRSICESLGAKPTLEKVAALESQLSGVISETSDA